MFWLLRASIHVNSGFFIWQNGKAEPRSCERCEVLHCALRCSQRVIPHNHPQHFCVVSASSVLRIADTLEIPGIAQGAIVFAGILLLHIVCRPGRAVLRVFTEYQWPLEKVFLALYSFTATYQLVCHVCVYLASASLDCSRPCKRVGVSATKVTTTLECACVACRYAPIILSEIIKLIPRVSTEEWRHGSDLRKQMCVFQ